MNQDYHQHNLVVPRMRTLTEAYACIKEADPETAFTANYVRCAERLPGHCRDMIAIETKLQEPLLTKKHVLTGRALHQIAREFHSFPPFRT